MKLTINHCLQQAELLGVAINGDVKFRGLCQKEDDDLSAFFSWVRLQHSDCSNLIFHVENEFHPIGGTSFAYHAKSKAKGRVDGIADIICLPISNGAPAFICELKRRSVADSLKTRKQKEHFLKQIDLLSNQQKHGAFVCVALGFDAAKQSFVEYVNKYKD